MGPLQAVIHHKVSKAERSKDESLTHIGRGACGSLSGVSMQPSVQEIAVHLFFPSLLFAEVPQSSKMKDAESATSQAIWHLTAQK